MANDFPVTQKGYTFNAGHFQMYFKFEAGGVTTPQGEINGFVNSFEAYFDESEEYDPMVKGMNGSYDMLPIMSSDDYSFNYVAKYHSGTHLWELDLTQGQAKDLLVRSLREAASKEKLLPRKYNTMSNSCISRQLELLNQVLPNERKLPPFHQTFEEKDLKTMFSGLSGTVYTMLSRHGILKSATTLNGPDEVMGHIGTNGSATPSRTTTTPDNPSASFGDFE